MVQSPFFPTFFFLFALNLLVVPQRGGLAALFANSSSLVNREKKYKEIKLNNSRAKKNPNDHKALPATPGNDKPTKSQPGGWD